MYVLLETVTVIMTQTLLKNLTAILTVTFMRTATACMNVSVVGEQQLEFSSKFSLSFEMIVFHHPPHQVLERWKNLKPTCSFLTSLHTH